MVTPVGLAMGKKTTNTKTMPVSATAWLPDDKIVSFSMNPLETPEGKIGEKKSRLQRRPLLDLEGDGMNISSLLLAACFQRSSAFLGRFFVRVVRASAR